MLIIAPEKKSGGYQGHQDSYSGDHEYLPPKWWPDIDVSKTKAPAWLRVQRKINRKLEQTTALD